MSIIPSKLGIQLSHILKALTVTSSIFLLLISFKLFSVPIMIALLIISLIISIRYPSYGLLLGLAGFMVSLFQRDLNTATLLAIPTLIAAKLSLTNWLIGCLFAISLSLLMIRALRVIVLSLMLALSCFLSPGEAFTSLLILGFSSIILFICKGVDVSPLLIIPSLDNVDPYTIQWIPSDLSRLIRIMLVDFVIPLQLASLSTAGMLASIFTSKLRAKSSRGVESVIALIPALSLVIMTQSSVLISYGNVPSYSLYALITVAALSMGFTFNQILLINERLLNVKKAKTSERLLNGNKLTLDDVGDMEWLKEELYESIVFPLTEREILEYYKIKPVKGILLFGPPGCGKTLIMRALAGALKINFLYVRLSDLLSKWYGESERRIAELFSRARESAPCILFLDELDALGRSRDLYSSDDVAPRLLSMLLSEMDGIDPLEGVIVVAATNAPHLIDPALLRPGRFDKVIYVPPPDQEARVKIFEVHLRGMPLGSDIDLKKLATLTEGFSGADIAMLCQEVARRVALEAARSGEKREIKMSDFIRALSRMKPSITPEMLQKYEEFRLQFERQFIKSRS